MGKIKLNEGKLIFIGNGASASLASHAATDFTKQAKIRSVAFNDHNLITALSNDYGYQNWVSKLRIKTGYQHRVSKLEYSSQGPARRAGLDPHSGVD